MRTIEEIEADLLIVRAVIAEGRSQNRIQEARLLKELEAAKKTAEPRS